MTQDSDAPSSSGASRQHEEGDFSHPTILYDGICGLCNGFVQFVLRHDHAAIFRFASLQSPLAARILSRHGVNADDLDTVYAVLNPDQSSESLLARSNTVIYVLKRLGGIRRLAALALELIPRPIRDWGYRVIARNRYRIFGRHETCPIPDANQRDRFVDL